MLNTQAKLAELKAKLAELKAELEQVNLAQSEQKNTYYRAYAVFIKSK